MVSPADQPIFKRLVPIGVEPVTLQRPCRNCRSTDGYHDTRSAKFFCAMCGKTVIR